MIVRFVDIGVIIDHHFLEVIVRFVDIGRIIVFTINIFNEIFTFVNGKT